MKKKDPNKNNAQDIFDFFFEQIEFNCRELGYGDTTINKKMKNLVKLFYEILIYCENWKQLQINEKNNILVKFFTNTSDNKILTRKLTNYFSKFASFIEYISLNSLLKGVFNFVYKE